MAKIHFTQIWAAKVVLGRAAGIPAKDVPNNIAKAKAMQMAIVRTVRAASDPKERRREYKRNYQREYMRRRRAAKL